jgi:RNA polymerase sigma factor (sigma-70 family)
MASESSEELDRLADADLITRARGGDDAAYEALYTRHLDIARHHARLWTRQPADADDLVSEAFLRVLQALRRGNGPDGALLPYLLTTMRRVAIDWTADERRLRLVDGFDPVTDYQEVDDPVIAGLDRSLAAQAFASLSDRWQAVLWYTAVEGAKPAEIATVLGIAPRAVSALAYRAREGLRQAYLQAHITQVAVPCEPFATQLGEYVRGSLGQGDHAAVSTHLADCQECTAACHELALLNTSLPAFLAPLVVGAAAAAMVVGHGSVGVGIWLLRAVRRVPKRTQAAAAATAAAILAAALAFALTGSGGTLPRRTLRAAPPTTLIAPVATAPTRTKTVPPTKAPPPVTTTTAAAVTTHRTTAPVTTPPPATTPPVHTTAPPTPTSVTTAPTTTAAPSSPTPTTCSDLLSLSIGPSGIAVSIGVDGGIVSLCLSLSLGP